MYIPIQEFLSCSLNTSGHALTCTSLCLLWLYEQVIVCVMDVYMQYLYLFLPRAHKHVHHVQSFLR